LESSSKTKIEMAYVVAFGPTIEGLIKKTTANSFKLT
jgi:hypothetical protein